MNGYVYYYRPRTLNFRSFLNGAERTLNLVNQAIPIYKEIAPVIKNGKTVFRILNEFTKDDSVNIKSTNTNTSDNFDEGPTFFN